MGLKEPPELEGGGQAHMKSLAFAPSSFNNSKNEETDASLSFFFLQGQHATPHSPAFPERADVPPPQLCQPASPPMGLQA